MKDSFKSKNLIAVCALHGYSKVIVHVDMDMFYAAVEMRDQPELADKPMAVGGMGMLSTSNYKVQLHRSYFVMTHTSRQGDLV